MKSKGFSHVGRILRDSDSIHVLFDEFTDTISQSSQKTNLYFNQPTFRVNASRPGFGVRNVTEFKKRLQLVTARRWLDSKVCFRKVGSKRRKVMPEFTFEVGKKTHAQRHVSEDEDDEHDPNQEAGYSYMNKLKFSFSAITYPFGYRKSSKNLKLDRLIKSLLE